MTELFTTKEAAVCRGEKKSALLSLEVSDYERYRRAMELIRRKSEVV